MDVLRADRLGIYGYDKNITPNIDELSEKGIVFENAIAQSSWTLPSAMSLHTSMYPSQHGITNKYSKFTENEQIISNLKEISPDTITMAQVFKENRYSTVAFTGGAAVQSVYGFDQGFDIYDDNEYFGGLNEITPKTIEWIKNNPNKKFFMYLHVYDIHRNYNISDEEKELFIDKKIIEKYKGDSEANKRIRDLSLDYEYFNITEEEIKFWNGLYDAKVYSADKKIGLFFEELEKLELFSNTIIIFTSDHGDELYDHGRFDHGIALYDELIKVPLVIWIPEKSRFVNKQVRLIDLMPTLFDILDFKQKPEEQMQGTSIIPLILGKKMNLDAFSETDYLLITSKRSLRTNDWWKFIYSLNNDNNELYNLNRDSTFSPIK